MTETSPPRRMTWRRATLAIVLLVVLAGIDATRIEGLFNNEFDPTAARDEHMAAWSREIGPTLTRQKLAELIRAHRGRCELNVVDWAFSTGGDDYIDRMWPEAKPSKKGDILCRFPTSPRLYPFLYTVFAEYEWVMAFEPLDANSIKVIGIVRYNIGL